MPKWIGFANPIYEDRYARALLAAHRKDQTRDGCRRASVVRLSVVRRTVTSLKLSKTDP